MELLIVRETYQEMMIGIAWKINEETTHLVEDEVWLKTSARIQNPDEISIHIAEAMA